MEVILLIVPNIPCGRNKTSCSSGFGLYDSKSGRGNDLVFTQDITDVIKNRDELRELNYLMDAILNNIPVYLFVKDPEDDFRYLYWNKAFASHSKIPASKALGHTDFEVFPN